MTKWSWTQSSTVRLLSQMSVMSPLLKTTCRWETAVNLPSFYHVFHKYFFIVPQAFLYHTIQAFLHHGMRIPSSSHKSFLHHTTNLCSTYKLSFNITKLSTFTLPAFYQNTTCMHLTPYHKPPIIKQDFHGHCTCYHHIICHHHYRGFPSLNHMTPGTVLHTLPYHM